MIYYPTQNDLYNVIIQEALRIGINPTNIWYYQEQDQLSIEDQISNITLIFTPTEIVRCITTKNVNHTTIPYTQYTTLPNLLKPQ